MDIVQVVSLSVAVTSCFAAIGATVVAYTTYRKQTSPEVIVYIDSSPNGSNFIFLYIENIGTAPAYRTSVEFDGVFPMFLQAKSAFEKGPFGAGVPFLRPGGKRAVPLKFGHELIQEMGNKVIKAKVTCFRSGGQYPHGKYVAEFPIETMSLHGCASDDPRDVVQLKRIAKAVETSFGK